MLSSYILQIYVLQFALLMEKPIMRVEWRCITMAYGVQYVMMDGIGMMHKLYAMNWTLVMQFLLYLMHSMDRVVDRFGLIMWTVLVLKEQLETVHTEDGDHTIVIMAKMQV